MNLVFRHKGRLRQGEEFIHFYTGDVFRLLVYVSHDGAEIFLVSRALTGAFTVRGLSTRQWMQFRAKYHIEQVSALPSSGALLDAVVDDAVTKQTYLETESVPMQDPLRFRQQFCSETKFTALPADVPHQANADERHSPDEACEQG